MVKFDLKMRVRSSKNYKTIYRRYNVIGVYGNPVSGSFDLNCVQSIFCSDNIIFCDLQEEEFICSKFEPCKSTLINLINIASQ